MYRSPTHIARYHAYRWLAIQVVLTLVVSLACCVLGDVNVAYSVFLGAGIAAVSNGYFIQKTLPGLLSRLSAKKWLHAFYRAETGKYLLTAGLFSLAIAFVSIVPLAFFLAYLIALLFQCMSSFWLPTSAQGVHAL